MSAKYNLVCEQATTFNLVDGVYQADADGGVLYNSFHFNWPITNEPIISNRDLQFLPLSQFQSPF